MFSRGFGGFVNFTLVIGNLLPNVALYQAEPHLDNLPDSIILSHDGDFVKSFYESFGERLPDFLLGIFLL